MTSPIAGGSLSRSCVAVIANRTAKSPMPPTRSRPAVASNALRPITTVGGPAGVLAARALVVAVEKQSRCINVTKIRWSMIRMPGGQPIPYRYVRTSTDAPKAAILERVRAAAEAIFWEVLEAQKPWAN